MVRLFRWEYVKNTGGWVSQEATVKASINNAVHCCHAWARHGLHAFVAGRFSDWRVTLLKHVAHRIVCVSVSQNPGGWG